MSQIEVDKVIPQSGTALQVGESGDTITIPAGATITNNGTANGFSTADSQKVKVSSNDTTAGFLNGKLVAGTNISLTEGSDGGNETLTAALTGTIATAQIADDAVTLAKMAPGTDGNIISYDASGNPVAVATGSAGQVLTSAGAGAPPTFSTAASSDFVKISTTTVSSGVASVSLTGMNSTYKNYKIIANDIKEASFSNPNFRFINASGDITSSAYYGVISGIFNPYNSGIGDANVGDYNTSSARVTTFDYSSNTTHASTFEMIIANPSNSATYPVAYGQSFTQSQNGDYVVNQTFGYTHTSASAVTGIKFYINNGANITGGNFSLYGIKG